jgi:alpha-galactosidase
MTIKQTLSRTAAKLAAVALVALGVATMAATSAQAAPETNRAEQSVGIQATQYRHEHVASGLCLDASVSQGVRLNNCNPTDYQQWVIIDQSVTKHVASGLCLDGSVSQGVRLNNCNGSDYQRWYTHSGSSPYNLVNRASDLCLDASVSQGVRLNTCKSSSDYQKWRLRQM